MKESLLNNISNAKKEHLKWMKKANSLNNQSIKRKVIEITDINHLFKQWLYLEGSKLNFTPSIQHLIKKIEYHNNHLNDIYIELCKIFFLPSYSMPILSSQKQEVLTQLKYLNIYSKELIGIMDIVENRVSQLSDSDLSKIY